MEKEIKITPPKGYEIDKENSTFDYVKFKKIIKRWRDNNKAHGFGYCISLTGSIKKLYLYLNLCTGWSFATEKQAKSALAMANISQIMANDERFGGVITDEEWKRKDINKYTIYRLGHTILKGYSTSVYEFIAFHTKEQRDLFIKENEDLLKDYFML